MPRIAPVTIWFWLAKTMITGADVDWPDYLYRHCGQIPVTAGIVLALVAALIAQFRTGRYLPWVFWPTVIVVSVAGTELANGVYDELHLPYLTISIAYLIILGALLIWWRICEKTVSLRHIDTASRERFYWAASLIAFALGTAIAHTVSTTTLGLALWTVLIAGITIAWKWLRLNAAVAFWSGYVLTRPLGTSVALLLSNARDQGGLGLGQWPVSATFAIALAVVLACTPRATTPEADRR
jgi:uncharacterized membrane-anchored protein